MPNANVAPASTRVRNQVRSQVPSAPADMPQARLCQMPAAMAIANTATATGMARLHGYWPCSARYSTVPVNISARIDSASHGQIQPPLKASSVTATSAASAAPTSRGTPDQPRCVQRVAEVGLRQEAADRHRGGRERQRVPTAAAVDAGHEQRGE